jgi:hypothetical protein
MLILLAIFLTVSGLFFTYVSVGLVRAGEKRRGYKECEERLRVLRRQLTGRKRT